MRILSLLLLTILTLTQLYAQNPVADFSFSEQNFCQNEPILLENKSRLSDSYVWDFCDQDFSGDTETNFLSSVPNAGRLLGIDFVKYNGIWYAFATSWNNNKLLRLTFSNGIDNAPTEVLDLGNPGKILNGPVSIHIIQDSMTWYGLIHNWGSSSISKITFGADLLNDTPSGVAYVNGVGGFPSKMDVVKVKDSIYTSVIQANGSITLIDLSSGLEEEVTSSNIVKTSAITGVSSARDIELVFDHNRWHAFIASFNNGKVFRADFGEHLMSDFASTPVEVASNLFDGRINNIEITKSGYGYYLHVLTFEGGLFKVKLDALDDLPTTENSVKYGESSAYTEGYVLTFLKEFGRWYGFTLQDNSRPDPSLYTIKSKMPCPVSTKFSSDKTPTIYYTEPGQYAINLTVYDQYGNCDDTIQYVTVTENVAPSLDFTTNSYCVNTDITLTGIADQQITEWQWIVEGDTSAGEIINYNFTETGAYNIILKATSVDGCHNRLTKEITIYEPPAPGFTIPEGIICTNGEISFTNQTDAKGADDIISYQWNFNGEGSSTEEHPSFVFTTGGTKTVTLTASIPGCSETYTQAIEIEQGPAVGFEVPYVCQGVEVQFTNTTTGEGITAYQWDFGDGGTYTSSTATDPFYTYDSAGTHTVTLTVTNDKGCANVFSQQVEVYSQPVASFLAEVACVGMPMQFTDQSTSGTTANIIDWQWDFGDGKGTANVRNPAYTYTQPGTYQVRLEALSSAGCIGTVVQEIIVETPVTADFAYTVQCDTGSNTAYTVHFEDASQVTTGNRITQWLWTIGGESFTTQNIDYTFAGPGTYEVTLTATAASACSDAVTKTIEILSPPAVAFTYEAACAGEPAAFVNTTEADTSVISGYTWDFDGIGTSFDINPQFVFTVAGTYSVSLTAHTKDGCAYQYAQEVNIVEQPQAKFLPSATHGAYPFTVQFENQSTHDSQHTWIINGDTLKEQSPAYTFTEAGQFEVLLTVENALGCAATASQNITVVEPVWDVSLENVRVTTSENDDTYQIVLTIHNAGTVPAEDFPVHLKIDQLMELREHFQGQLPPGERINYVVPFTLSTGLNQHVNISYICATLQDKSEALPDVYTNDNRMCVNLEEAYSSLPPYPNPVKDRMNVSLILTETVMVEIQLEDSRGSMVKSYRFPETNKGLNVFKIDMSTMAAGVYFVQLRFSGNLKTYRVVVQH